MRIRGVDQGVQEGVGSGDDTLPKLEQAVGCGERSQAYEIPSGRPLFHDIGAAIDASAVDAAAEGYPNANKPANEDTRGD